MSGEGSGAEVPPRRAGLLPGRSPVVAVLALGLCGWLLWDMWPDVAYFLSSTEPIDLGAPGAYHLDRARANRLVRIAGAPVASVGAVESRSGSPRRVMAVFGTNLAVDRPGPAAAATVVYEGRLLPPSRAAEYAPFVEELRRRGWAAGDRWMVLRDGERPRERWGRPALSVLLLGLAAVNLRALSRSLSSRPRGPATP